MPQHAFPGNHDRLLGSAYYELGPQAPAYSIFTWTLGRGSVIWRIWPAVLLHTTFAAVVVTLSMRKIVQLDIPSVMLTVLGVVIGFVISYRASSGYDRYWQGRTCWSDIIQNARTMGRLIWLHVPPRLSEKTAQELETGKIQRPAEEMLKVMAEKLIALDLVEGFAVALKHHIRGELGIYYEDLYHLVKPMHEHAHTVDIQGTFVGATISGALSPRKARTSAQPPTPRPMPKLFPSSVPPQEVDPSMYADNPDPVLPPINTYGTFDKNKPTPRHHLQQSESQSSSSSSTSTSSHHLLLPSTQHRDNTVMSSVSTELIPFSGVVGMITRLFGPQTPLEVLPPNITYIDQPNAHRHRWQGPIHPRLHSKHRPKVAGGGENLPLAILQCLSEWYSVLEDRGTVPGTSMGSMMATVAAFEESLTALECILTTPLPFVYSVHISTVWLYLFFLPFQLVTPFGYYTIPGVAMAAFIYLGFLAAGEEIEQPFGYDDNDLDLDLFCHEIIHADIEHLKMSPCLNAYFSPSCPTPAHRQSMTLAETSRPEIEQGDEPTCPAA